MFGGLTVRQSAQQVLNLLMLVSTALMIWKGMAAVLNTESPIVVVLSESMEPAFKRGDLLLLSLWSGRIQPGDITVFKLAGREVPIVHRVIQVHDRAFDGEQFILTKGDNNQADDREGIYNPGQQWISHKDVVGRVVGHVPSMGMMTIWINDYPVLKYLLVGGLGIMVLLTRE